METQQKKVYVAAGWFNDNQMEACKELEDFADSFFREPFKPRVDNIGTEGCDWDDIFLGNIEHINSSDLVIASTVDKDMGTIWECGYAFAKGIPIIYYTPGIKDVNLMLAKSGVVCKTIDELEDYIVRGIKGENYGIE